jgi:hypothetical protein
MRLVLRGNCIETTARNARSRIEAQLLDIARSDPDFRALAADLDLLTEFLRDTDFAALRAARPELDGRAAIAVELRRGDDGAITCYTQLPE